MSASEAVTGTQRTVAGALPRRFALQRWYDVTNVSGTGIVAYGTLYPSGKTALAWCCGDVTSVTVYDDIGQIENIHGHNGYTGLVWIDPPDDLRELTGQPDSP